MARPTLNLKIILENVHCYDEADGWGDAEPYLWPVFFKIDGDSYAVGMGTGLIGFPTIEARSGGHGNLNDTDVDEGDDVPVPETLGAWQSKLKPIPIYDEFIKSLVGDDLPGICGVVVVLMEEDGWPDDLAVTGYNAFVNAVTFAVAKVANGFQHALSAPTKAEIDAAIQTVKDTAAGMVRDAVKGAMSGWQLAWYGTFGNNDDTLGTEAWTFTHTDFAAGAVIGFSRRWQPDGDGDWELNGTATGVEPCPADAFSNLLRVVGGAGAQAAQSAKGAGKALAMMREFRAKEFVDMPGLGRWWRALHAHTPDIIRVFVQNAAVREAAERLFSAVPDVLGTPHGKLPEAHLQDMETLLQGMRRQSPRLGGAFAREALKILPKLKGKTWHEAVRLVSEAGTGRKKRRDNAES